MGALAAARRAIVSLMGMSGERARQAAAVLRRYGRMTVEDAAQLGSVFLQVASRQASDALVALRRRRSHARSGRGPDPRLP